ncbi:nuclear condensing complex subunit, C-term domain-containing protein, partial [Dimargaris cristalligena]
LLRTLTTAAPELFQGAQVSVTQHRRNAAALRKLQERCSQLPAETIVKYMHSPPSDGTPPLKCTTSDRPGESIFNNEFVRNLNKILPVKKREASVELVVKFVAMFVHPTNDDGDVFTSRASIDPAETITDSLSSRFIEFLMHHLLKGFNAKDKLVRLRVCQLVALCVNSFGEIDEELYVTLKTKLYERIHDKESAIRVQAVIALCRLQNGEDEDEDMQDPSDGPNVTKTLLNIIRYDPSAEVRRAVLIHITKSPSSLPRILERSRDLDTNNRRFVYLKALKEIGDFRILSIEAREKLLSHGINDREPAVRQACIKLLSENWMEYANNNLIELLERLDVVNSTIAEPTLIALFTAHPDIPRTFEFTEEVWQNLTPETVFLIQVTLAFFEKEHLEDLLEAALPEVVKLAMYIQHFTQLFQNAEEDEQEVNCSFIVGQLLTIATRCDFADEMGRRRFLSLLREMLLIPEFPEAHIETIIDIILKISINERDFTQIIVEAIVDIRTSIEDDDEEANSQMDPEERQLELLLMRVKCLIISKLLLERCQERLRDNHAVFGLLNDLFIPAINESEAIIQELGLMCLAHCCYLDKSLAEDNTHAFVQAIRRGEGDIREKALMALSDLSLMYDIPSISQKLDQPLAIEATLLECVESPVATIQAIATEGIVRLLYCQKLSEPIQTLETLLFLYFHPVTEDNNRFRQCLTYFLQVYCYSAHDNQKLLQQVMIPTLNKLAKVQWGPSDSGKSTLIRIGQQLADWTDPRATVAAYQKVERATAGIDEGLHATIAIDALKSVLTDSKSARRTLIPLIRKLHIDEAAGETRLKSIMALILTIKQAGVIGDAPTRNALDKFEGTVVE